MRIDIRFLNQLPEGFLQQYPDLMALREADADRDGFIVEDNTPSPPLASLHEGSDFLRRIAQGQGRTLSTDQLETATPELMEEFRRVAEPLRVVMATGRVSLEPLRSMSGARRDETHAHYLFEEVNQDFDNSIDLREFRNAISRRRHPVISWLRGAADEQYRIDQSHQHRLLPSIFHYVSYIPRHLIQPDNLFEGLSTMWRYMNGEGNSLRPEAASPYSWRGGMQEEVEQRHIRRIEAIDRLEQIMGENPEESVNSILNRLRTSHPLDAEILTRDLRIQGWEAIEAAPNPQARGRAAMNLAQIYRDGDWNFNYGEGTTLGEFFSVPFRNNDFAMAQSVYRALEDSDSGMPDAIRREAATARRDSAGNGRSLLGNLLPIDFDGNGPLWGLRLFGRWREDWSDEATSFNNIWDEAAALGLMLVATRGAAAALRWGGGALWSVCGGARLASHLAARSGILGVVGRVLGGTAVAMGEGTSSTVAMEALTQSTWQTVRGYAGRSLSTLGRGVNQTLIYGTYGAMLMAERHALRPPNLETDHHIDYSLRLSPTGDEGTLPASMTREDLETLALLNLVALHLNIQEEIRRSEEEEELRVAHFRRVER